MFTEAKFTLKVEVYFANLPVHPETLRNGGQLNMISKKIDVNFICLLKVHIRHPAIQPATQQVLV